LRQARMNWPGNQGRISACGWFVVYVPVAVLTLRFPGGLCVFAPLR
jgi:hypothetical protein